MKAVSIHILTENGMWVPEKFIENPIVNHCG